jgi:hypothetical protein
MQDDETKECSVCCDGAIKSNPCEGENACDWAKKDWDKRAPSGGLGSSVGFVMCDAKGNMSTCLNPIYDSIGGSNPNDYRHREPEATECLDAHEQSHLDNAGKYSQCPSCGAGGLKAKGEGDEKEENYKKSECEARQAQLTCLQGKKKSKEINWWIDVCEDHLNKHCQ